MVNGSGKKELECWKSITRKLKTYESYWNNTGFIVDTLDSERAWFMSVYAVITGGVLAFMAQEGFVPMWPLAFLVVLTFFGFFHTIRWIHAFEVHRKRVNKIAEIIWFELKARASIDPTMDMPAIPILPKSIRGKKLPFGDTINEFFRTRYWFPLFYFVMLIGLVILLLAFLLFVGVRN